MRKLIAINTVLAALSVCVFLLGYYFIRFPEEFNIIRYIREAEWKEYGFTVLGLVVAAAILSFFPIRNYQQKNKAALFLAALQMLLLLIAVIHMTRIYRQNKSELAKLMLEYKEKAAVDIKNGVINLEYAGGLELPNEQQLRMQPAIDSVRKLYGFSYKNSGCTVSSDLIMAQEEYARLTKPYLDKRNGPGWKKRMQQQLEEAKRKYR